MQIRGRVASGDGVPIAYSTSGTGSPAAILVHGWSCDRSYWKNQSRLDDRFQTVTLDLAGHGESGEGRAEWTMPAYGDDVIAVIEKLNLEDVVLVGHSMGGNACLDAAARLGSSVQGLIWVDTYGALDAPPGTPSVADITAPFKTDFAETTRAFVAKMFLPHEDQTTAKWVVDDMSSAPEKIAVASLSASLTYGRAAHAVVGTQTCPILALNSDYLGADFDSLEAHGVEVKLLPCSGHFPMLTDVARFNALLTEAIVGFTL